MEYVVAVEDLAQSTEQMPHMLRLHDSRTMWEAF